MFEAQRTAEPRLFTDRLDEPQRRILTERLDALRTGLPCGQFAEVLDGFGSMRLWLEANAVLAGGDCNCNDDSDCGGNKCDDVSCTSPDGTRHWGVCPTATEVE